MTKKERYEYRRANGLCVQCGKPITGKKKQARCAKCRREHNQHQRERREYLRKLGRCYECGRPLDEEGYTLCKKCREDRQKAHYARCNSWANRRSRKARKRRNSRVAEGMCEYCGKAPVVPGRVGCAKCLKKRAAQQRKYRHMKAYNAKFYKPVQKVV